MGRKVKNKDLAAKLGVSCTLVSLVLNNKADQHGIRKDTQERVLALAKQMGYFSTGSDQESTHPVEEKPGVIGMIVPSMHNPFVYELTPYLQKAFSSIGIGFSVISKDPDDQRYNRLISAFRKFYTGLILVGDSADDYTIRALKSVDYPFILLEKNVSRLRLNTVTTDIVSGADTVTNHITRLGYNNVLIVNGQNGSINDESIVQYLTRAFNSNPDIRKPEIVEIKTSPGQDEINFTSIEKYLRPPYSIQLLLVVQANLVYPLMSSLQKKKIRIPQDVALISLEEGIGFSMLHPPVTSLKKPLSGLAIKVANMIWSEVKNSGKGKFKRQVSLAPELIVRQSCGTL